MVSCRSANPCSAMVLACSMRGGSVPGKTGMSGWMVWVRSMTGMGCILEEKEASDGSKVEPDIGNGHEQSVFQSRERGESEFLIKWRGSVFGIYDDQGEGYRVGCVQES